MENRQELKDAVKNLIVQKLAEDILEKEIEKFESLKKELSAELTRIKPEPIKPGVEVPMIPQTEAEKKMHSMLGFFMKEDFANSFKARLEGMRMMKRTEESASKSAVDNIFAPDSKNTLHPDYNLAKLRDMLNKSVSPNKIIMNDVYDGIYDQDSLSHSAKTVIDEYKPFPMPESEIPVVETPIVEIKTEKITRKPTLKKVTKKIVKKPAKKVTAASKPKKKK